MKYSLLLLYIISSSGSNFNERQIYIRDQKYNDNIIIVKLF
jgi:hypothetical protein